MPLHRAPSQFAPNVLGGPVTPSCCGCCCCCCCAGTTVAAGIALPLILHQTAPRARPDQAADRTPPPAAQTEPTAPSGPTAPITPTTPSAPTASGASPGRRVLGILIAALAIPLGILTAAGLGLAGIEFAPIPALAVMLGLAIGGYLTAGVRTGPAILVPIVIVSIAAVLAIGELAAWAGLLFADGETLPIIVGGLVIIAIPVITTTLILAAGRRRGRPTIPEHP